MKNKFASVIVTLLFTLIPVAAFALPITVYFDATVTEITTDSLGLFSDSGILAGTSFGGSFVYDDESTNLSSTTFNFDEFSLISLTTSLGEFTDGETNAASNFAGEDQWGFSGQFGFIGFAVAWWGDFGYGLELGLGLDHPFVQPPDEIFGLPSTVGGFSYLDVGTATTNRAFLEVVLSMDPPVTASEPAVLSLFTLGLAGIWLVRHTHDRFWRQESVTP